jgi:hypothetical protein
MRGEYKGVATRLKEIAPCGEKKGTCFFLCAYEIHLYLCFLFERYLHTLQWSCFKPMSCRCFLFCSIS